MLYVCVRRFDVADTVQKILGIKQGLILLNFFLNSICGMGSPNFKPSKNALNSKGNTTSNHYQCISQEFCLPLTEANSVRNDFHESADYANNSTS